MWDAELKLSKDDWFKSYVDAVIDSPYPKKPQQNFRVGRSHVWWFESDPGIAVIQSRGGNCDERAFAEWILKQQVEAAGYKRAQFTFDQDDDHPDMGRTASWDDIMEKAQRLIDGGQVQLLRNGYNNIVAQVQGDHGTYMSEIGRDDPSSRAITTWQCECPWDQYAWQRTRKWKKYEGRPCHLPGSMISLANGGFKPIEDIRPGDEVVTHKGSSVVTQDMVRPYKGRVFKIYRAGFPHPIRVTENHEIWAKATPDSVRNARYNQVIKKRQGFRIYDDSFIEEEPDWIDAQNLQVNDWIASTYVDDELEGPGNAWATILGYYLAEGNLAGGKTWREVQWTFHKTELPLHQELYDALTEIGLPNHRTYYPKNRNCVSIRVSSKPLAEWLLRLGGHLASHKTLNGEILRWPTAQLECLIDAWAKGDGDLKKDGRQAINTSSPYLARQLYDILVRCGYIPSWTIQKNNGGPQNRQGECIINRITFKWHKKNKTNGRRKYESRYMSKITKIEEEWYEGPVYNFSVKDHESYVAEGVTNHNCAHVLAAYWLSQATPLDEDAQNQQQQLFNAPATGAPTPSAPSGPPAAPQGQQLQIPGIDPGMAQGTAPVPPGQIPGQPSPDLLPPFPQAEKPPPPVSIPGGKVPGPLNPVQYPGGTFSSWKLAQSDEELDALDQELQAKLDKMGPGLRQQTEPQYRPGSGGKGFVDHRGFPWAWETNGMLPSHGQMARAIKTKVDTPFIYDVDKDGVTHFETLQYHEPSFQKIQNSYRTWLDPDMRMRHVNADMNNNWSFESSQKLADKWDPEQGRWIADHVPDIPIYYTDEIGNVAEDEGLIDDFRKRRPLIFDGSNLYVGGYNQSHLEAAVSHGLKSTSGTMGAWMPEGGFGDPPGHVSWFGAGPRPEWQEAIYNKLNKKKQEDPWSFESSWKLGNDLPSIRWWGEENPHDFSAWYNSERNEAHLSQAHHYQFGREPDVPFWSYDGALESDPGAQLPLDQIAQALNQRYGIQYDKVFPHKYVINDQNWNLLSKVGAMEDLIYDKSQWGNLQVRLNQSHYGIMQGKSEAHGAGQYKEIPANSIGTLMEVTDELGGQANVIFAGPQATAGPLEPYHVQAWVPISDITPMAGVRPPGPFIRRRNGAFEAEA